MQSPRIVIGWLAFILLIAFSIFSFIVSGSITLEVWISLLITPAALALALNRDDWWNRDTDDTTTLVEEEEIELNSNKEYLNDKKNKTGYTIVHIMPYEKKSSFFNPDQTEDFVLTREYMENNKTKHAFNKVFPNHVPDSSSESM